MRSVARLLLIAIAALWVAASSAPQARLTPLPEGVSSLREPSSEVGVTVAREQGRHGVRAAPARSLLAICAPAFAADPLLSVQRAPCALAARHCIEVVSRSALGARAPPFAV